MGQLYFGGQQIAEYANGTTYFVHPDHLGSSRLLTGVNQSVVQSADYLPFGELLSSNSWNTDHLFTGDERDSESGLDHTWFRQYSSSLGRWMHPDPAGLAAANPANPQSWNRYAYVVNNPTALTDKKGLAPMTTCGGHGIWQCNEAYAPSYDYLDGGYSIFDAISGAPETYLSIDMYGNLSFGFSDSLYVITMNAIDEVWKKQKQADPGTNVAVYPTSGFQVLILNSGFEPQVFGLIPEIVAAKEQQGWLESQLPSGFWEFHDDLVRAGIESDEAWGLTMERMVDRDPNYAPWLGQWGTIADQMNNLLDQFSNMIFPPNLQPQPE